MVNGQWSIVKCSSRREATRGQSLVETLVALGIITTVFLGMFALLSRSLSYGRLVSDDYLATYLAAEGIEIVKNIVDANFLQSRPFNDGLADGDYEAEYSSTALRSFSSSPILFDNATRFYGYSGTEQTGFTRRIRLTNIDLDGDRAADMIRVNSMVTWTSGGGAQRSVNLEGEFYNWRP